MMELFDSFRTSIQTIELESMDSLFEESLKVLKMLFY